MKEYKCINCFKKFTQKSHLDKHMNKKKTCKKCPINYTTKYAKINGKQISVKEYLKSKPKKSDKIKCLNNHELILVNGEKNKAHFRHKNKGDVGGSPMTKWHSEWQSNFPITEIDFNLKEGQTQKRRADVVIKEFNRIIEIQHSNIDKDNVYCRNKDYRLHNMKLIWIIDGNTSDVKYEKLSTGNYLIIFNKDWKYKSFCGIYKYILLDIDEQIFKIPIDKICNKMIEVNKYIKKNKVITELLSNPKNIWNLWKDDNKIKSKLFYWQKGAGNGKTYGLWEKVIKNQDKNQFILITKTHSGKSVIRQELNDQMERNEYYIEKNMLDFKDNSVNGKKQYVLNYKHKISKREITIIIATVDSFYFNITDINYNNKDPFSTLVENFLNDISKINPYNGHIKFAGKEILLNKKTQIWIDEAQDLPENNLYCMTKLMLSTGIDVGIIGDKLQSLQYNINMLTKLDNNLVNINIIRPSIENNNRRIKVKGLAKEINKYVKFEEYGLPEINANEENLEEYIKPFEILKLPNIIKNDHNEQNINKYCKIIIEKLHKEIIKYNYLPQDILISSPILKGRLELIELKSKLEDMWIKLFNNEKYIKNLKNKYWIENNHNKKDNFIEYVQLHKSETGKAINLDESKFKTRIVSVITSKGDGRNVCLVLNINEQSLKKLSNNKINLIYESYIHVALTRAKKKIFFSLSENNDDIHKRFSSHTDVIYCPKILNKFCISKMNDYIDYKQIKLLFEKNNIKLDEEIIDEDKINNIIDFNDHCIRYAVFKISLHLIFNKTYGQTNKIYSIIKDYKIKEYSINAYWNKLREYKLISDLEDFPIIKYNDSKYNNYTKKIKDYIEKLLNKLNDLDNIKLNDIDYILLCHIIDITVHKQYATINVNEIYSIINKLSYDNNNIKEFYSKIKPIQNTCKKMIKNIETKYGKIEWNLEKSSLKYNGLSQDFIINKMNIPIIGNNKKTVINVIFKTSYSQLNRLETLIEVLSERFLLYNPMGNEYSKNNITRFKNKKIITYVIILETNEYKEFNWEWDKENEELKEIIKNSIIKYYESYHTQIIDFYLKVLNNWNKKWFKKNNHSTPFKYLIKELKYNNNKNNGKYSVPNYIIEFINYFKNLFELDKYKFSIQKSDDYYNKLNNLLESSISDFFTCKNNESFNFNIKL